MLFLACCSFFKNISQSDDPDLAKYCSVKCQFCYTYFSLGILLLELSFWLRARNAVQGITTSLFSDIKTFTQFKAYYVMSDMKWYDRIKLHHKGLGQVWTCSKRKKTIENSNLKHITSCLTWNDTIVSNCIIRI